jgi:hypothetical protein
MTPSPRIPTLQVVLTDEQLDDLARRIARKLQESSAEDLYDQDHLPAGMSRRTYLASARAGEFETRKVGRRVVVKREDLEGWISSHPSAARPPRAAVEAAVDADLATIIAANGARVLG